MVALYVKWPKKKTIPLPTFTFLFVALPFISNAMLFPCPQDNL